MPMNIDSGDKSMSKLVCKPFALLVFAKHVTVKCRGGLKVTRENERISPYRR